MNPHSQAPFPVLSFITREGGFLLKKNYVKTLLIAGMLLSFIGVTICSMIYMAKDNNYNNTIFQYFNISKQLYSRLIYLKVGKETLISGMNLCSLLFLYCHYTLSSLSRRRKASMTQKRMNHAFTLIWIIQGVLYQPFVYRFFYEGGLGFLPDPAAFRHFYSFFHRGTVLFNLLTLILAFSYMAESLKTKESIRELRYVKITFTLIDMGICILYFYMFFSLPSSFLWISRAADYVAYTSLEMNRYIVFMRIIPYLTILFILILWYNLFHYDKAQRQLKNEEHVFSSIVVSSEISSRSFSHYVKNELLAILTKSEYLMKKPDKDMEGLESIRQSCLAIYERMDELQRHSGRIVLNRSVNELHEIIRKVLQDNKSTFLMNEISVNYIPLGEEVRIFCDPHYLGEVFQNIINNAVEAMNSGGSVKKELQIGLILYELEICVQIADTGPGTDPSVMGRIFEPFVSTKATKYNWGIGLSFTKRIITSHNGKIEVCNRPEGGAQFSVYLPVIQ